MSMLNTAELCLRKGKDSKFRAMHVFSQFVKKKKKKRKAGQGSHCQKEVKPGFELGPANSTSGALNLGTQGPSLCANSPTSPAPR